MTHWADVLAKRLLESHGPERRHTFATAITPSGPIHLGNMREVLTTEAVFRALKDAGGDGDLLYIADDYDPLRKVYPFLKNNAAGIDYRQHVGKPLREVPAPDGSGRPYSEHFLEPFLAALEELGVHPTVLSAYDMYHEGRYVEHTVKALDQAPAVRGIVEEVTGRSLGGSWVPFNPQAQESRMLGGVEVVLYEYPELHYRCTRSGEEGILDVREPGIGKLPWRVDWPARWDFLGVTFESFGKDHGASGGSWDTGVRIAREVFGAREPCHTMYEFLHLKGRGAMHSSTGVAVSAEEVLRMTPPEVMRFLLVRPPPRKHLEFDPGLGLLGLVDDFDRLERVRFGVEENPGDLTEVERTYALSCPNGPPSALPAQVNFRHLVTVVQVASGMEGVERILRRSGALEGDLDAVARRRLERRVAHARHWLETFAPEDIRFQVLEDLPPHLDLDDDDRALLAELVRRLAAAEWTGQDIHDAVYEALEACGMKPGRAFRAVYRAILGRDRGPRAGFFLASLEKDWVLERLRSAAGAAG